MVIIHMFLMVSVVLCGAIYEASPFNKIVGSMLWRRKQNIR